MKKIAIALMTVIALSTVAFAEEGAAPAVTEKPAAMEPAKTEAPAAVEQPAHHATKHKAKKGSKKAHKAEAAAPKAE